MTYKELKQKLEDLELMDPGALECDISIYDRTEDEYYSGANDMVTLTFASHTNDVLDEGHPIIYLRRY